MGLVQFVTFNFYAGAFYYGGWLVENNLIDFDGFMKALFVIAFMASGAGQAATYAGATREATVGVPTSRLPLPRDLITTSSESFAACYGARLQAGPAAR